MNGISSRASAAGTCRQTAIRRYCQPALDLDVVNVTKITSMMEKATENTPPPPLPATATTARFARDLAEYRPVQLTLIPGGCLRRS
jgi:hypothetical protein